MNAPRVLEIKQSIFEGNARQADLLRSELRQKGLFLVNLMSAPGAGKTTLLLKTIETLGDGMRMGVLVADGGCGLDARAIARTGVKTVSLPSGGLCHLNATMTRKGLETLGTDGLDCVFLENIGNLVCTAEFDTGSAKNVVMVSIPEGSDKPLKHPFIFSLADLVLVAKADVRPHFEFDADTFRKSVAHLNAKAKIIELSAKTGAGMAEWHEWLRTEMKNLRTT